MPLNTDSITFRNCAPAGSGAVSTSGRYLDSAVALCCSMCFQRRFEICHEAASLNGGAIVYHRGGGTVYHCGGREPRIRDRQVVHNCSAAYMRPMTDRAFGNA